MLYKITFIILLLISTPCFSGDKIDSYKDENGNTIFYTKTENRRPISPRQPQYAQPQQQSYSPTSEYRHPKRLSDATIHNNPVNSKKNPGNLGINSQNRPLYSRSSTKSIMDVFARQLALVLTVSTMLFIAWLIALIDILRNQFTGSNKLIWFLTVTFLPFIGSFLYFIIGRNQIANHQNSLEEQEAYIRSYEKPKI